MKISKTNIILMQNYKRIWVSMSVFNIFIEFLAKENCASSFQVDGEVVHIILVKFCNFLFLLIIVFHQGHETHEKIPVINWIHP